MTNPGDIERRLNPSAIKKGSTWGTEVDVNAAGNGILPLNAGVPALKMTPIEDESAADPFETLVDFTDIAASDFSLDFEHRYEGRENMLLAMLMGTAGAPVAQFLVTGDWHVDTAILSASGAGYTVAVHATTGGTGTGCTVNVLTVDAGDQHIDTFSIAAGGLGYKVGDILTIAAPGTNATITVTKIDSLNGMIDFNEGGAELTGSVPSLLYTGATLATAIAAAMTAAPGAVKTYVGAYNAATGKFTISTGTTFAILWFTGTHKATDISALCGFSDLADDTTAITYTSDTAVNTVNLHTFSMSNTTFGIFGTYATAKHTKIHVVPSFKVLKAVFSMSKGLVKSVFSLRGNKVIDTSSIITAMSAVTYPDIGNRVKFQGVFRMNAQSGDALDAEDAIGIKGFSLEPERKMDSEITNQAAYIIEPRENGKPSVKLTLDFARMDDANAAYFASWIAETEQKADITFTGATINGVFYRYLKFEFPRLKIEDVDYPDGNIIPAKMVLRGLVAAGAPEGMPEITDPIHITLQNGQATDYLA